MTSPSLDQLLERARTADPRDRIELRDPIAAHGEAAIDELTDWLADPRLAAFAVRVLERIGRDADNRAAVVAELKAVDREDLAPGVAGDIDVALQGLGVVSRGGRTAKRPASVTLARRIHGVPGVPGRRYWVMRTSPGRRELIWAEAAKGNLRQGWGWDDSQDLEVIAELIRVGKPLSDEQQLARRSLRMRTAEPDGVHVGDLILAPHLPAWGRLSVFRVAGSYRWDRLDLGIEDGFGHVLPVELLAEGIDRSSPEVTDELRSMLHPQTRLYRIDNVGGDVERLVAGG